MSFASAALSGMVEDTLAKKWGADKPDKNATPTLQRPNGSLWIRKYKILVSKENTEELSEEDKKNGMAPLKFIKNETAAGCMRFAVFLT